jgi:hypothetical protein
MPNEELHEGRRDERREGTRRPLVRGLVHIGDDRTFEWASGGRPEAAGSEGNGQPPNDAGWGLWFAATRPESPLKAPGTVPWRR